MVFEHTDRIEFWIGFLVAILAAGVLAAEHLPWLQVGTIEVVSIISLYGILALLYSQQGKAVRRQADTLEIQNRMLRQEYEPNIRLNTNNAEVRGNRVYLDVYNSGPGIAFDIGFEIRVRSNGEWHSAFCPVVRDGDEHRTPGFIEGFEESEIVVEMRLPSLDDGSDQWEEYTTALDQFSYDPGKAYDFQLISQYRTVLEDESEKRVLFHSSLVLTDMPNAEDLPFFN